MNNANYKKWLVSGVAISLGSIAAAVFATYWALSSSFAALETNESASIDAVGGGIETALYFNILFTITGLIGLVLITIGGVKAYRHSKSIK